MNQLQEWYNNNKPDEKYVYASAATNQFIWVRDTFVRLLINNLLKEYPEYEENQKLLTVDGTHTSKSVLLPVYRFDFNGVTIKIRGNFHDWCFRCWTPMKKDFPDWMKASMCKGYFEGMENDPSSIAFCVNTKEDLYAITWWVLNEGLDIKE